MATSAEQKLAYADSSALVKLVVREAESAALVEHLRTGPLLVATSRVSLVEVRRAALLASPGPETGSEVDRVVEACLLVDVTDRLLREAAALASQDVRSLDAIHLATAERVDADELLVYDRRLASAARARGLVVAHPGVG